MSMFATLVIVALLFEHQAEAFNRLALLRPVSSTLSATAKSPVGKNIDDLEDAQSSLESLIAPHVKQLSSFEETDEYVPPPLTSSSRNRRIREMELLASLEDSDHAIDELMHLWLFERDVESGETLVAMEKECSPGLVEEEESLRAMIDAYGVDWPEPANRLAALLYYKGRSEESMVWADKVLRTKPWHFEAIHLQVLNCLRLKDSRVWQMARQRLPPLEQSEPRKEWVGRALQDAKLSFQKAEDAFQKLMETTPPPSAKQETNTWQ